VRAAFLTGLGALTLALGACGEERAETTSTPPPDTSTTALEVVLDYDGDGPGKKVVLSSVSCNAPTPKSDFEGDPGCDAAAQVERSAFDPVAPDAACTQIYGGPETVELTGIFQDETLQATFSRENGCEIERLEAVAPLLEVALPPKALAQLGL
jgi:hypothetical protein